MLRSRSLMALSQPAGLGVDIGPVVDALNRLKLRTEHDVNVHIRVPSLAAVTVAVLPPLVLTAATVFLVVKLTRS